MKKVNLSNTISCFLRTCVPFLFSLIVLCPGQLFAQEQTTLDTNPPSVKWMEVNTQNFRVVFPKGFDEQGIRVANNLEYIHDKESKSLGRSPRLITVILQNQSAASNGFVTMLPRRSEFFGMPPQDYNFVGTNDWLNLLSSHEFRHVVQYQNANRGFNRAFYYMFGATTMAGFAHLAVPQWFWEGDAVVTETAFTGSGRGKIPNFSLVMKTNLLEGRTFNYHKQWLRSYKNNIPDHYVLGYHMVRYLRKKSGDPEIWGKITSRAWSYPFLPFVFSRSIKRKAGVNVAHLYKEMAADLKQQWSQEIDSLTLTPFERVPMKRSGYTDFSYPQQLGDGRVVVMKTGIGNIAEFMIVDRQQTKIFTPGYINDSGMLSAEGSTIVWNEYGYDPRWNMRNYSLIKAYDLKRKKRLVIGGKKARYTSAAISPDEMKIVAARTTKEYKTQLVILSYPEGKVLQEIPNPENRFYSMARWSHDGDKIVSLVTANQQRGVVSIDPVTGLEEFLIPFGEENVGYPVLHDNFLLFNSPVTGIDNIFAVDIKSGTRYQITTSRYAAYNPNVSNDGKLIFYNDQTRDGLDVVMIKFDPSKWKVVSPRRPENSMYDFLVKQEGNQNLFSDIPQSKLQVRKFSRVSAMINPYNWGFFVNNTLTQGNFGITSQDVLSTTVIDAGYTFDTYERTSAWKGRISYQGWFPIIDVSASTSNRSSSETLNVTDFKFKWHESTVEGGLRIPLVTTHSKFASRIEGGSALGLTQVSAFRNTFNGSSDRIIENARFLEYIGNGNLVYSKSTISAFRLLKKSRRDIYSKWGQSLDVTYSTTIGGDYDGELFSALGKLYFPGLAKHHSLWGYAGFQRRYLILNNADENAYRRNYLFRNQIPFARGFSLPAANYFYSSSVNYALPVWYPDVALGPIVNIQRLRFNAFLDYSFVDYVTTFKSQVYSSTGVEARLDVNFFRLLPQFEVGVRYSYGLSHDIQKFEILLGSINL